MLCPKLKTSPRNIKIDKYQEFYESYEWRRARYDALCAADGKCQLCGRSKHDGIILNVDHIVPLRKDWSQRLSQANLQVLCHECNHGKGNRDNTDWRSRNPVVKRTKAEKRRRRKERKKRREKKKVAAWKPGPASKCRLVSIDEWLDDKIRERERK